MRVFTLTLALMGCAASLAAGSDNPPKQLTPDERKELEAKWLEISIAGRNARQAGKLPEAAKAFEDALALARRLYPKAEFPEGHQSLAATLNNLAVVYKSQRKLAEAEPLLKEALDQIRRLFKDDNPNVAAALGNLADLYQELGKSSEAERYLKDELDVTRRLNRGDHVEIAACLVKLAVFNRRQGNLVDAERGLKEALEMFQRLFKGDHIAVSVGLNNLATLYRDQRKFAEAEPLYRESLEMTRRLFKGDHVNVATSLSNLASLYDAQGRSAAAEPLYRESLEMRKRLFKGDHTFVATGMNQLAQLLQDEGKLAEAASLHQELHEMRKRLFNGDHPDIAQSLNNLAVLYLRQGNAVDAVRFFKASLDMHKRLFKGDHPSIATSLNNLAQLLHDLDRFPDAESYAQEALAMRKRLFKGDHPSIATSLNNLATVYRDQGKLSDAEPLLKEALGMHRRLSKGDHDTVVASLSNLGATFRDQGNLSGAEPLLKEALDMQRRMIVSYAKEKSDGEALTFQASLPLLLDDFLSLTRSRGTAVGHPFDPATAYSTVWIAKGSVTRVFEQRQQQARAATADPALAKILAEQADARRRRAELLLAPTTNDRDTLNAREANLRQYEATITKLTETLTKALPAIARAERLNVASLAELQKALPADAAVVDYYRYTLFEFDNTKPAGKKETRTERYAAFVVTRARVSWVDLETARRIETAVGQWREAITTPPFLIPEDIPAKVRALVWEPVRKHVPASTKVVYICPDAELTRLPWVALPGDKPGSILLEQFAIANIPHGLFLLDSLWPADKRANSPTGLLTVGGVAFADETPTPKPVAAFSPTRGDPLIDPKKKLNWQALPGAKAEAELVAKRGGNRMLETRFLTGTGASTDRILSELTKVKYAHIATHGFFADASFRSVLQVDPKAYGLSRRGERIGRIANSPMVMSGLVFAGANIPGTPGRGIITGESLIDRDLSGLELAVLSACETGLGDVAGGEGVFGLQRAFHVAGCRNVIATLWKVDDTATAALMAELYSQLWTDNQPPLIALQKAQLAIYRADAKDFPKMALRGIEEGTIDLSKVPVKKYPLDPRGGNHPALWASFTLSGPGR